PHACAVVARDEAVGVRELHLAPHLVVPGGHLHHLVTRAPSTLVALDQQLGLALGGHLLGPALDRLRRRALGGAQRLRLRLTAADRGSDLPRDAFEITLREAV